MPETTYNPNRLLACPVCGRPLIFAENRRYCEAGHSFDLAKEGYVNLLMSNKSRTSVHGDNKEMVAARERFLSSGAYAPLKDRLCQTVSENIKHIIDPVILDAGCGEGYYTAAMAAVTSGVYGLDISKDAVRRAAKRCRASEVKAELFVAGAFDMPCISSSADLLISIFAPLAENEFARVLKDEGRLIRVVPGKHHLFDLKRLMYEAPYENSEEERVGDKFHLVRETAVDYPLTLDTPELVSGLIKMTPYFYRTAPADIERVITLGSLTTRVSFRILEYEKNGS